MAQTSRSRVDFRSRLSHDLLLVSHFFVFLRLETGGSHRAEGVPGLKVSFSEFMGSNQSGSRYFEIGK
jgi:hypothetical protein